MYERHKSTEIEDDWTALTILERPVNWKAKLEFLFKISETFDTLSRKHELCEECVVYHDDDTDADHSLQDLPLDLGEDPDHLSWEHVEHHCYKVRALPAKERRLETDAMHGGVDRYSTRTWISAQEDRCLQRKYRGPSGPCPLSFCGKLNAKPSTQLSQVLPPFGKPLSFEASSGLALRKGKEVLCWGQRTLTTFIRNYHIWRQ